MKDIGRRLHLELAYTRVELACTRVNRVFYTTSKISRSYTEGLTCPICESLHNMWSLLFIRHGRQDVSGNGGPPATSWKTGGGVIEAGLDGDVFSHARYYFRL